jgi:hypothetical protein
MDLIPMGEQRETGGVLEFDSRAGNPAELGPEGSGVGAE